MEPEGKGSQPEQQPETWVLLNEELRLRLGEQRAAFVRLEGRAAIVLAAAFAALQFVAREDVSSGWLPFALAAYGLSMLAGAVPAVWPKRFEELKPRSLVTELWWLDPGPAAAELANNRLMAFEINVKRQRWLTQLVRTAVVLAIIGATMSTMHLTRGERTNAGRDTRPGCTDTGGTASGASNCGTRP